MPEPAPDQGLEKLGARLAHIEGVVRPLKHQWHCHSHDLGLSRCGAIAISRNVLHGDLNFCQESFRRPRGFGKPHEAAVLRRRLQVLNPGSVHGFVQKLGLGCG